MKTQFKKKCEKSSMWSSHSAGYSNRFLQLQG